MIPTSSRNFWILALLTVLSAVGACAVQESSDLRSGGEIDKEDFIAYPPLPGTGTYLTVKNAEARCKTKSLSADEYEVSCAAVIMKSGQEILATAVEANTKISWKLPISIEDKNDFSSSCVATSDIVQTCKIKTRRSNFLEFGFEIFDNKESRISKFEVLLPFAITLTGGVNMVRNVFQSPDSLTNNPTGLSLSGNSPNINFGYRSPRLNALGYPIDTSNSCSSKLGLVYSKDSRIFRILNGSIELYTGPNVPVSKTTSRHHFKLPSCVGQKCQTIACTDDGLYIFSYMNKSLNFVPEDGEVKNLLTSGESLPIRVQNMLAQKDGSLVLVANELNPNVPGDVSNFIYDFKDQNLSIRAGGFGGRSYSSLLPNEAIDGVSATSVSFKHILNIAQAGDGSIFMLEQNGSSQNLWRLKEKTLFPLATYNIGVMGAADFLDGAIIKAMDVDSKNLPVFLTNDRRMYRFENGVFTEFWSDSVSSKPTYSFTWADDKKNSVNINYENQTVRNVNLLENNPPKIIAGAEIDLEYEKLFKDGPRNASETTIGDPQSLVMDDNGDVIYVDRAHNALMKIDTEGKLHMLAGGVHPKALEGPLNTLSLFRPFGVNITKDGTIILADSLNRRILGIKDGEYWTIAGGGTTSTPCSSSVGALSANVRNPGALAITDEGKIYYPDWDMKCVYEISSFVRGDENRTVKGILGYGTRTFDALSPVIPANEFRLDKPGEVILTKNGDLLVTENLKGRILRVKMENSAPVSVSVYIGGGTVNAPKDYAGSGAAVKFQTTSRISLGQDDSVYFLDSQIGLIRKATPVGKEMMIETIFGHLPQDSCGFGSIEDAAKANVLQEKLKNNLAVICNGFPVAIYVKENCAADPNSTIKMVFSQRFKGDVFATNPIIDFDDGSFIIGTEWPCQAPAPVEPLPVNGQ